MFNEDDDAADDGLSALPLLDGGGIVAACFSLCLSPGQASQPPQDGGKGQGVV